MASINIVSSGGLVTAEIKPRRDTYYLVTSDNLRDIKSKGLLADLFMLLASISWGAYFSVAVTIKASSGLSESISQTLDTYRGVFWWASCLFTVLAVVFVVWSFRRISDVKRSSLEDTIAAPAGATAA